MQGVRTAYVSRVLLMIIGLRGTKKAPIKGAWKISKLLPISIIPQVDIRFNRRAVPMNVNSVPILDKEIICLSNMKI